MVSTIVTTRFCLLLGAVVVLTAAETLDEIINRGNREINAGVEGVVVSEGDQVLTNAQYARVYGVAVTAPPGAQGSAGTSLTELYWPDGTVHYEIHSSVNQWIMFIAIRSAMNEWMAKTCIKFVEWRQGLSTPEPKRLLIRSDTTTGCWSYVGFHGWQTQNLSLDPGCHHHKTVLHELGHALGLWHEQSRPDRDHYIEIMKDNIKPTEVHNFEPRKNINSRNIPYDYTSIMHYGQYYFKKARGLITIKTKDPNFQDKIGNYEHLSDGDVRVINEMYCPGFQVKGHTSFNWFGNSCYSATTTPGQGDAGRSSWDDQRKKCKNAGGDLASVETQAEWEHIFNELKRLSLTYYFWLGGYCTGGNNYKWLTGSVISNSNPAYLSGNPGTCSSANEKHIRTTTFPSNCKISDCWKTVAGDANHAVCEYPC